MKQRTLSLIMAPTHLESLASILNDTCAWTPNKVFIHLLLVSVDNECVGKCRQVYASVGKSARQVEASLGKSAATECVLLLILPRVLSSF